MTADAAARQAAGRPWRVLRAWSPASPASTAWHGVAAVSCMPPVTASDMGAAACTTSPPARRATGSTLDVGSGYHVMG